MYGSIDFLFVMYAGSLFSDIRKSDIKILVYNTTISNLNDIFM